MSVHRSWLRKQKREQDRQSADRLSLADLDRMMDKALNGPAPVAPIMIDGVPHYVIFPAERAPEGGMPVAHEQYGDGMAYRADRIRYTNVPA